MPGPGPSPLLDHERREWALGRRRLAGIDEAGRGPLAGPVVAAAVCIERPLLEAEALGRLAGLTDSKRLSAARREHYAALLASLPGVRWALGTATPEEIDRDNILQATHRAMRRAVEALPAVPDFLLVDGLPVPGLPVPSRAIVGGDGLSLLIAAASVLAKVHRDRMMAELDRRYPVYGFARHKGYGSRAHMQALFEHGPCPAHRRSFRPVREAEDIRRGARERGERPA
jgi:ribonuclease HII